MDGAIKHIVRKFPVVDAKNNAVRFIVLKVYIFVLDCSILFIV